MEQGERQQWGEYMIAQKRLKAKGSAIVVHQQPENFRVLWNNHTDSARVFSDSTLKSTRLPAEDLSLIHI